MNGGHQAALDAPLVVQHLGDWRQAVGGAGSGGNNRLTGIGFVVDAVHEHRRAVLGRCALYNLFGTSIDVLLAGFFGEEEASAFDHQISADIGPLQVSRITLGGQANGLAVNHQVIAVNGDITVEVTVYGIVLEHVGQVIGVQQVVDTDHFDVAEIFGDCAECHATDTAKTINTDFDCHIYLSVILLVLIN